MHKRQMVITRMPGGSYNSVDESVKRLNSRTWLFLLGW